MIVFKADPVNVAITPVEGHPLKDTGLFRYYATYPEAWQYLSFVATQKIAEAHYKMQEANNYAEELMNLGEMPA